MPLPRIAWLATVVVFLIAALLLFVSAYYGYAVLVFAVALSASINLLR